MDGTQKNEHDLLERAKGGDVDAACALLKQHAAHLRRELAGKIPPRWRAVLSEDDILQQTFADALVGFVRFENRGDGALAAWLSKLARCNLCDALKMLAAEKRGGKRRRVQLYGFETSVDLCNLLVNTGTTPSQHASRNEIRHRLDSALNRMPRDYAEVVRRCDLDECDMDDICVALQRSRGAVYMLRARAHDRLRALLGPVQ